jgi:hypothetical protein
MRLIFKTIAVVFLAYTAPVFAQTTEEGVEAAMEGRFADAKAIWEQSGDAAALRNIGGLYVSGVMGVTDLDLARAYFERSADMGDAQSMLSLGYIYRNGMGVEKNGDLAEGWFAQAANLGLAEAKFMWARTVLDRSGDRSEVEAALGKMNEAAAAGNLLALNSIGDLLRSGTFAEQDVEKALSYYQSAANNGLVEAWNTIGDIYLFAELGAPDIAKAIEAYMTGAENGNTTSMYSLAYLFYNDPGADDQLRQTAFNYAQTAALAWDEQAQLLLGKMFLDGTATTKDDSQAYFWLDLAASAGVVEAHHLRALAYAGIGAELASAVHEQARKWFSENHAVPHTHRLLGAGAHSFQ